MMATPVLSCLAVILSVSAVTSEPTPSEAFPHYTDLVPNDKYHLFWKFDKETITFEVHVKAKGYVGLGISPGGSMKGADIVLGWVKDGKASLLVSSSVLIYSFFSLQKVFGRHGDVCNSEYFFVCYAWVNANKQTNKKL